MRTNDMFAFNEPSWKHVDFGMAVGAIGLLGLVVLRATARRKARWGSTHVDLNRSPGAPRNEMLLALARASAERAKRRTILLASIAVVAIIFGFNFGIRNYRLISKMDEAEARLVLHNTR